MWEDEAMGEIVNLRRAKKRLARTQDAREAKENRVRFGRTGAQKLNDQRAEDVRAALLDGSRRQDDSAGEEEPGPTGA
jgi:hypothetical protein